MRYESREARFSNRVLLNYAATNRPEMFAVRAAADGVTEILLYDEIGYWGVTAKDFIMALAQIGDGPINVRINSPGGDVFDGMAIFNALKARNAPVTVTIDGLAASAASFIAMAGETIAMGEMSMMMIHNCWGFVMGNRNDMIETAAIMEKLDGQMAAVYATRTGKTPAECAAMMDAETWFTPQEAMDAGLCDSIVAAAAPATPNAAIRIMPRASIAATPKPGTRAAMTDPDEDGDDDAAEALGLITSAQLLLTQAAAALAGTDEGVTDPVDPAAVVVIQPEASDDPVKAARERRLRLVEAEAA